MTICDNLCDIVKACETLTALAWDPTTNTLSYTDEHGDTTDLALTVASINYDPGTRTLTIVEADGQSHTAVFPDQVTITGIDTPSVDLTIDEPTPGTFTVQADVKISAAAGNTLIANPDGLYAPPDPNTAITGIDTPSVSLTVSEPTPDSFTVQADVNVSATAGNLATILADGVYVPACSGQISRAAWAQFPAVVIPGGAILTTGQVLFTGSVSVNNDLACGTNAYVLAWVGASAYVDFALVDGGGMAPELLATVNGVGIDDGVGSGYNAAYNLAPIAVGGRHNHDSGNFGIQYVGQAAAGNNVLDFQIAIEVQSTYPADLVAIESLHAGIMVIAR